MKEGKLGVSTGEGFYDFHDVDVNAYRNQKLAEFVELLKHLDLLPQPRI